MNIATFGRVQVKLTLRSLIAIFICGLSQYFYIELRLIAENFDPQINYLIFFIPYPYNETIVNLKSQYPFLDKNEK